MFQCLYENPKGIKGVLLIAFPFAFCLMVKWLPHSAFRSDESSRLTGGNCAAGSVRSSAPRGRFGDTPPA